MACLSHLYINFSWFKMWLPVCSWVHITPILLLLHWLLLQYRTEFKIELFVYKAVNCLAPQYLSELLTVHNPVRSLRSQTTRMLWVPRTRLKCRGDRAFSVAGPKLWNTLPLSLRTAYTVSEFKWLLKTHLFSCAFNDRWLGCFKVIWILLLYLSLCNTNCCD